MLPQTQVMLVQVQLILIRSTPIKILINEVVLSTHNKSLHKCQFNNFNPSYCSIIIMVKVHRRLFNLPNFYMCGISANRGRGIGLHSYHCATYKKRQNKNKSFSRTFNNNSIGNLAFCLDIFNFLSNVLSTKSLCFNFQCHNAKLLNM